MQYANDRNIPFVAIVGESEMAENVIMLKDMTTGNQEKVLINDIISKLAQ
jgi:histidyl-tRNA synthetase